MQPTLAHSSLLRAVHLQSSRLQSRPLVVETVRLNAAVVCANKAAHEDKPVIYLHGLFGSASTFKCYA